jgi:hypothetical protein
VNVTGSSLNVTIVQGNSKNLDFNTQGSGVAPVNLDLVTAIVWTCAYDYENSSALITKTLQDGQITVLDSASGIFRVVLEAEDTLALAPGCYRHEAVLTDVFGEVLTVVDANENAGCLEIRKRIAVP